MSARKLQQEFDKLNKKISEGLQIFDDIKEKINVCEVPSQRDKLENDLKKELKKLQRLRDQLKQWLGDSSIKLDKNVLQENRTKIEHAMDQFKELEKALKIKQFSNEGLELQTQQKRSRFGDDAKYQEACTYINGVIDELNNQNEDLDQELDSLSSQLKRKGGSSVQQSIDDVKYKMERNNNHINKLEEILENLDNDKLDPARIDDIKDDLDYYVENNQDEDYVEYDEFYDQLDVEEEEDEVEVEGSLAQMAAETEDERKREEERKKQEEERKEREKQQQQQQQAKNTPPASNNTSNNSPIAQVKGISDQNNNNNNNNNNTPSSNSSSSTPVKKLKPVVTPAPAPPPITTANSYSNVIKAAQQAANNSGVTTSGGNNDTSSNRSASPSTSNNTPISAKVLPPGLNHEASFNSNMKSASASPSIAHSKLTNSDLQTNSSRSQLPAVSAENKIFNDTISRIINVTQSRLNDPLPLTSISNLLENSLLNCPDSYDSEKPRQYNPINVHPSLIDYPQEPMYELNSGSYMKKFDNDTLFFCFYYGGGGEDIDNFAKYNAAKELSKRGWIFNTEFNQWFLKDSHKKHRTMSMVAKEDESNGSVDSINSNNVVAEISEESDNYKYFDYEKTWLTRRRENYKFVKEKRQTF